MNKKIHLSILVILLLMAVKPCMAQKIEGDLPPIDSETKNYKYEEVVEVKDNANKSELYRRAKPTILSLFNSETNIIQTEDTSQGYLVAKVYVELPKVSDLAKLFFTITVQVKDNKYRYVIDNLTFKSIRIEYHQGGNGVRTSTEKPYESPLIDVTGVSPKKIKREANSAVLEKIASLKKAMETGASGNLKKDW